LDYRLIFDHRIIKMERNRANLFSTCDKDLLKKGLLNALSRLKTTDNNQVAFLQIVDNPYYPTILSKEQARNPNLAKDVTTLIDMESLWKTILNEVQKEETGTSINTRNYTQVIETFKKLRQDIEETLREAEKFLLSKIYMKQPTTEFMKKFMNGVLQDEKEMAIAIDKLLRHLGSTEVQVNYLEPIKKINTEFTSTLKTSLHSLTVPHIYEKPIEIPILEFNSKVLTDSSLINFLMKVIETKEKSKILGLKVIFRASEHGFRVQEFHKKCDKESNLLVLVKSSKNKTFGAYTGSVAYPFTGEWFIESVKSFLFSVDYQEIYSNSGKGGIMNHTDCGPKFGANGLFVGSSALSLSDECHKNNKSFIKSDNGYSFSKRKPEEVVGEAGGSTKFTVVEYEVWKIIFVMTDVSSIFYSIDLQIWR